MFIVHLLCAGTKGVLSVNCLITWSLTAVSIKVSFLSMALSNSVLFTCPALSFIPTSFVFCTSAHFF